jgi:phage shock protein PspC (stress-responsive transcriptional regulator)
MIAGVAAGLADRFGMSRLAMRLLFVVLAAFGFPILTYVVLWIVIPEE